jgi:hypothetical protein
MCKEMPVIPVKQGGAPEKNNRKKWRAKEEERHKGLLTPIKCMPLSQYLSQKYCKRVHLTVHKREHFCVQTSPFTRIRTTVCGQSVRLRAALGAPRGWVGPLPVEVLGLLRHRHSGAGLRHLLTNPLPIRSGLLQDWIL